MCSKHGQTVIVTITQFCFVLFFYPPLISSLGYAHNSSLLSTLQRMSCYTLKNDAVIGSGMTLLASQESKLNARLENLLKTKNPAVHHRWDESDDLLLS